MDDWTERGPFEAAQSPVSRGLLHQRPDQPAVDLPVAFDLAVGRILPHDELSTSSAQATSKLRVADERGCATLELGLVAEEQPRLAVLDDRTVPRDVRSEDGAAEPER